VDHRARAEFRVSLALRAAGIPHDFDVPADGMTAALVTAIIDVDWRTWTRCLAAISDVGFRFDPARSTSGMPPARACFVGGDGSRVEIYVAGNDAERDRVRDAALARRGGGGARTVEDLVLDAIAGEEGEA
jgi:hypothetical protein